MVHSSPDVDLNNSQSVFSCRAKLSNSCKSGDMTLHLDCFGYGLSKATEIENARKERTVPSIAPDDGCRLVLGLGPTPSNFSDNVCSFGTSITRGPTPGSLEGDSILRLGLSGGSESVSELTNGNKLAVPVVDEGSTSAKKSGGYMTSLLLAPRMNDRRKLSQLREISEPFEKSHFCPSQMDSEPSAVSKFSTDNHSVHLKKCNFFGCVKGARGATGLCIGHGGGQRCQKLGCNKGAESRTAYCKAHGGGRRCQHLGCTKSAEGKTDFCIAHGGGRRCGHPGGCNKAARGKSGLCIKHGGGKRCKVEGCARSAEGQVGLCISHGGGRRCQFQGCTKGAQGSTMHCKAHGGGKRCVFAGCTKGAEGSTPLCKAHGGGKRCLYDGGGICPKSVHGGTNFCVGHGGGKRCAVPGCTKSARGRTDCCVKHGGGKRCKSDNCTKSAQGSTDFCKAHGGGKRCNWGEGKCEKFARGRNGLCAAHCTVSQERDTRKKGSLIGPRLFHGLVPTASAVASSLDSTYSSSGASAVSESIDSLERPNKRQHLIPPQVLVPPSMKSSALSSSFAAPASSGKSSDFMVPEGRVHGGGLLSLLGGDLKNAIDGI